jgi:hypothetical protein
MDGKIKAGQAYTKTTYRYICDEEGVSWLQHRKRIK